MKRYIIILALIIIGCSNINSNVVINLAKEDISDPLVYFCPKENCEELLVRYINNSEKSIHCALYDIDLEKALAVFSEKSKKLDVKIVVDNDNWNSEFTGKGIIKDTKSQLMHNKFCIFDNSIVLTGSFNPTENDAFKNNNNVIIIESKLLSNNYELEFNELWNYNFGKGQVNLEPILYFNGKKYENYFCPEDGCQKHVLDELENSQKSIYFMIFSFTDSYIADKLIEKNNLGLDVRGIVEAKRITMEYEQYNPLFENNVLVKKDKNNYTLHHKVFIIDNQTVITGSYNPTKAADEKNDENILIINDKDVVQKYLDEFDDLFS